MGTRAMGERVYLVWYAFDAYDGYLEIVFRTREEADAYVAKAGPLARPRRRTIQEVTLGKVLG
jgi:hypothetical protein